METSIVIPVKDDEFVYTCLGKILENFQGKIPLGKEILVINDKKSKEEFSTKLKKFCKEKGFSYFRAEEPGASYNRNKGVGLSKGRKILFIDSDCFPSDRWIPKMEKSLEKFDLVEGRITYDSKEKGLFDRIVENKSTPNRFLTANLGIKKEVGDKCKFDKRFIVFREDTDFGLDALEKGFKSTFNENAEIFHRKLRFTPKRFITERKRYVGEPLLFKKHKSNSLLKNHIPRIWRISHPLEIILLAFIVYSIFNSWQLFLIAYFFPGVIYSSKKYFIDKRTFKITDTFLVLILIPLTMIVKRIYIWKGAIKFKVFLI